MPTARHATHYRKGSPGLSLLALVLALLAAPLLAAGLYVVSRTITAPNAVAGITNAQLGAALFAATVITSGAGLLAGYNALRRNFRSWTARIACTLNSLLLVATLFLCIALREQLLPP